MVEFFSRLFVKDYQNTQDKNVRASYGRMAAIVGVVTNLLLALGKLLLGLLSASLSVIADAVNNLSDAGSSLISFVCFKISAKPADRDHPYGHGRIEYVTSMIVAMIVLVIGAQLLAGSVTSILSPEKAEPVSPVLPIFLIVAVAAKLWLGWFNSAIGKKISSGVMRATAADSISDALSTTAVLIGAVVRLFFPDSVVSLYIDAVIGAFVSIFIIVAGAKILNETKNLILGEPPTKEEVERIEEIVRSYPEVLGIHDMMLHRYGPCHAVASLHVEVDGSKNMFDIHDAIDNIELQVLRDTGVVCTIHTDPIQLDADVTALRERVASLVGEIDSGMTIHDFRVVFGTTHSNLLFDIAVPFETKLTDAAVVAAVSEKVKTIDENYFVVVHIDRV